MSNKFNLAEILSDASTASAAPAGQAMRITMLPLADIHPNEKNSIYQIGDVSLLQADISEHGLRSPLEVVREDTGYRLVSGHRRYTACCNLHAEGAAGFDLLPCRVLPEMDADAETVALITSNATAREMTDGERIKQYMALKKALERQKAAGALQGRVREAMVRITGDGSGTLARLNAIATRCTPEVLDMLSSGQISMTRAYDCSKLYKVEQASFAKNGYSSMPQISDDLKKQVVDALLRGALAKPFSRINYVTKEAWNYCDNLKTILSEPVMIELDGCQVRVTQHGNGRFGELYVDQLEPGSETEVVARGYIYPYDMYYQARALYLDPEKEAASREEREARKQEQQRERDEEKARHDRANEILAQFDTWRKVAQAKELGLVFRAYDLHGGGSLVVAVDEVSRVERVDPEFPMLPYRTWFSVELDAAGNRLEETEYTGRKYKMIWKSGRDLALRIMEDLQAKELAQVKQHELQE